MKTTLKLGAIAMAASVLLSSTALPVTAGGIGIFIDKPIVRVDKPLKPSTRPGRDHDGPWHVEHDEPDPEQPKPVEGTTIAGGDPQPVPKDPPDNGGDDEEDDVDKYAGADISCVIWPDSDWQGITQDFVQVYSAGTGVLKEGTLVEMTLGDGTVYQWIVPADTVPGGSWAFYSTLQADFPADTGVEFGDCTIKIVTV